MTNYNYDGTIPNPPDDPGDDVTQMQTNSASIGSIMNVDHVGFNATNGGIHRQVSYNSNQSTPGLAGGVGVNYTNSNAGMFGTMSSLFFDNGTKNSGLTNITLTTSGNNSGFISPWGLIINFGSVAATTGGATVTFAVPFNSVKSMVIGPTGSSHAWFESLGNTTASVKVASGTSTVYYFAVGT